MVQTVADIGEFGLIDLIAERTPADASAIGIGDDAAVVQLHGHTVSSVDTLIEGRHFKYDWSDAADVGHRAAAASLADIAAMGARPRSLLLALAIPADTAVSWALELVEGVIAEAEPLSAYLVGGDVCRSDVATVSVTAIGETNRPVTRAGARVGDTLAIAGRQGWAAAGLTVLSRGFRSPRALVNAYQRPHPPYESGPAAAAAGATAMIDVSDGLLGDVRHLAQASGVLADLDSQQVPVSDQLVETASAFNVDPLTWVLAGGDDHALVATFPAEADLPGMFNPIGRITDPAGQAPGVSVDGRPWTGSLGHDHFN